jgi:hypothetical protein
MGFKNKKISYLRLENWLIKTWRYNILSLTSDGNRNGEFPSVIFDKNNNILCSIGNFDDVKKLKIQ